MRERRRATIEDLRQAIECLPRATRLAMLEGIESNEIVVGAYTDAGGICPMLAAHRAGGRTNFISFARAWDRFAFRDTSSRFAFREARRQAARRATARELLVLKSHLQASLIEDAGPVPELAAATAEHRRLVAARQERVRRDRPDEPAGSRPRERPVDHATSGARVRPGDLDRSRELRSRLGWAWTRIVRTHDDYELVLDHLAREREGARERDLTAR